MEEPDDAMSMHRFDIHMTCEGERSSSLETPASSRTKSEATLGVKGCTDNSGGLLEVHRWKRCWLCFLISELRIHTADSK